MLSRILIRFSDILFSVIGLIFLSPVFFVLAIWIKMDSKGPVFYKQIRVGKNEIDFKLFKFRSMRTGSELKGLLTIGEKDTRITKAGYFLRKFKLDELPQLINVLIGNMSIVGPRPEVRNYVTLYTEDQRKVLTVRPGITDYASISFAKENELLAKYDNSEQAYIEIIMSEKIKLNLKFINNYNFFNYIRIIVLTLFKIIKIS